MKNPKNIEVLLSQLVEGTISQEALPALQAELTRNPEVRNVYLQLLATEYLLAEKYSLQKHPSVFVPVVRESKFSRFRTAEFVKPLLAASVAAAIALLLLLGFSKDPSPVDLTASRDGHYRVDGGNGQGVIAVGQTLEVRRGLVSLNLSAHTTAIVEAPARLRLMDGAGNVEMLSGKAFFEVSPGGSGFEVHCPSGVIRDIGTKFGVEVKANGSVETSVMEGKVEIESDNGTVSLVNAGQGVVWVSDGRTVEMKLAPSYISGLPQNRVIFSDDFNEPDGTNLDQKPADVGGKWEHLKEDLSPDDSNPNTPILGGTIDTSFRPRRLRSTFQKARGAWVVQNYTVRISTRIPQNTVDRTTMPQGWEKIEFHDPGGRLVFSLIASGPTTHQWLIRDEVSGKDSAVSDISALADQELTFTYDVRTGLATLRRGSSDAEAASLEAPPDLVIDSLTISNSSGGDLALDSISIEATECPVTDEGGG